MNTMRAELRDWVKVDGCEQPTYQGRVFNDIYHEKDGTFKTIVGTKEDPNSEGVIVYTGSHAYWMWNIHRRKDGKGKTTTPTNETL